MSRSLRVGVRTRLLVAVVGAVAIALIVGVTAFNLFLGQRLSASAISLARAQAGAETSSLKVVDGHLVSLKRLDEGTAVGNPVWVFAGDEDPSRSRAFRNHSQPSPHRSRPGLSERCGSASPYACMRFR